MSTARLMTAEEAEAICKEQFAQRLAENPNMSRGSGYHPDHWVISRIWAENDEDTAFREFQRLNLTAEEVCGPLGPGRGRDYASFLRRHADCLKAVSDLAIIGMGKGV